MNPALIYAFMNINSNRTLHVVAWPGLHWAAPSWSQCWYNDWGRWERESRVHPSDGLEWWWWRSLLPPSLASAPLEVKGKWILVCVCSPLRTENVTFQIKTLELDIINIHHSIIVQMFIGKILLDGEPQSQSEILTGPCYREWLGEDTQEICT